MRKNPKKIVFGLAAAMLAAAPAFASLTPQQKDLLRLSLIHRGDGIGRPDNTMEALLYTWGRGYTPESDIRLTKDSVVVAFHDTRLKGRKIRDWTWAELREEDVGSYRGAQYATCRAPTWNTIFAALQENPSRRIHIDYKDVPPEQVAELVKAHGLEKQCFFITASNGLIHRYKKALPNGLALQWMNLGNWGRLNFADTNELARCERYEMDLFEKAAATGFADLDVVQLHCQAKRENGAWTFCPKAETLKKCAERLAAARVTPTIFVWKEEGNDPDIYKTLFKMGFVAFGTDYPEALYKAIDELDKGE